MAGKGGERLYWMHFEAGRGGAQVVPAPVLVESVGGIQQVAQESERPLIRHRRGMRRADR